MPGLTISPVADGVVVAEQDRGPDNLWTLADLREDGHEREAAGRLPRKGQHPHDQGGGERHGDEERGQHGSADHEEDEGQDRHGDRDREGVSAEQPALGA